jgi:hypothetical protein
MAKSKSKCGCWKGYKRVPGTKPCTSGSCMKMGEQREEKQKEKSPASKRLSIRRKKV